VFVQRLLGLCLDMKKFWPIRTFDALCLTIFQCFQAFFYIKLESLSSNTQARIPFRVRLLGLNTQIIPILYVGEQQYLSKGVKSVPTYIINNKYTVSGIQDPNTFAQSLRQMAVPSVTAA